MSSRSPTTTAEASLKTVSPSPEPSETQASLPKREPEPRPLGGLLGEPKVRQVLAQAVLASSRGTIPPQSLVEALKHALLDNFEGMTTAITEGLAKAGGRPGPEGVPDGTVSRYADGTVVEKRGGKWHEVGDDKGKPDQDRTASQQSASSKKDPALRKKADRLMTAYKKKLSEMKTSGASEKKISVIKQKIAKLKEKMAVKKSSSPFDDWESRRLASNILKAATYCRYMSYSKPEQLLYAVASMDAPADVTVAVKAATKALGSAFSTALQKELSK